MRPVVCAFLMCGALAAQLVERPTIDRVSIGADDSGRAALCEQLRRMPRRPEEVPILPEGASLECRGDVFTLLVSSELEDTDAFVCGLAKKPSTLVFDQLRPIALKRNTTVTLPEDLSEKLLPLGVTNVGKLLTAFGFVDLELRRGQADTSFRSTGLHELPLLCDG